MTDHDEHPQEARGQGWHSRGASIDIRDSRFSTFLGLLWAALGAIALALLAWAASSISELNVSVARLNVQMESMRGRDVSKDSRDDRQDAEIRQLNRDVSTLEGRNLRGAAEVKGGR